MSYERHTPEERAAYEKVLGWVEERAREHLDDYRYKSESLESVAQRIREELQTTEEGSLS